MHGLVRVSGSPLHVRQRPIDGQHPVCYRKGAEEATGSQDESGRNRHTGDGR